MCWAVGPVQGARQLQLNVLNESAPAVSSKKHSRPSPNGAANALLISSAQFMFNQRAVNADSATFFSA